MYKTFKTNKSLLILKLSGSLYISIIINTINGKREIKMRKTIFIASTSSLSVPTHAISFYESYTLTSVNCPRPNFKDCVCLSILQLVCIVIKGKKTKLNIHMSASHAK